jgi:Protein of unknown function (DUF1579)
VRALAGLLAAALALPAATAPAQTGDKKPERKMVRKPAEPVTPPASAAAMPKPAPEMAQLKYFDGTWRCDGDVPASPMGPAHKSRATVTMRPDLGGFWYTGTVREEKTEQTPRPLQGVFHETYDPAKKRFLVFWADSYGGWANQASGGWDGDRIVFEGEGALGGQAIGTRDTFVKKTASELTHTAEIRMGGAWTTVNNETCRKATGGGFARP